MKKIMFNEEEFNLVNKIVGCNQEVEIYKNSLNNIVYSIEKHLNSGVILYHINYVDINRTLMKFKDKVYIQTYNGVKSKKYMSLEGEVIRITHHPYEFEFMYIQTMKKRAIFNAWNFNGEIIKVPNCWKTT